MILIVCVGVVIVLAAYLFNSLDKLESLAKPGIRLLAG